MKPADTQKDFPEKVFNKIFWFASAFALIGIFLYFYKFNKGFSGNNSDWGSFGSYIGGMLQFITVAGLLLTIHIQNKTLEISKKELELSREELKGSREALEQQKEETIKRTKIDIFFNLFKMHSEISEEYKEGVYNLLKHSYDRFSNKNGNQDNSLNQDEERAFLKNWLEEFWQTDVLKEKNEGFRFSKYLSSIKALINYVHKHQINEITDFLRDQLTVYEKILLVYVLYFYEGSLIDEYLYLKNCLLDLDMVRINKYEARKFFIVSSKSSILSGYSHYELFREIIERHKASSKIT